MGAHAVSAPSVCAGLQAVLQQGWRAAFPLRASPWPEMAAAVGASPRELLQLAQRLGQLGRLQPIQARWGAPLRRQRWRLGFAASDEPARAHLQRFAARTSAVLSLECVEGADAADAAVRMWLHLEGCDAARLAACAAPLGEPQARWRLDEAEPDAAARPSPAPCPCADPALAAAIEQHGLPLVAHPYAALAARLGDRSERAVLARLRQWQQAGCLERLVLTPPLRPQWQRWQSWLLPDGAAPPLQPGLRRHRWRDPAGRQGWLLTAAGDAVPPPLPAPPLAQWSSQVLRLRPQAWLFA